MECGTEHAWDGASGAGRSEPALLVGVRLGNSGHLGGLVSEEPAFNSGHEPGVPGSSSAGSLILLLPHHAFSLILSVSNK